jgi:hypothetical protein
MKSLPLPRGGRLIMNLLIAAGLSAQAFAQEAIPRGTLNVDRSLVRVGSFSALDWKIEHPKTAVDVVDITDVGTIIPKKSVTMRVRTLGVAFQSGSRELPLDAYWSVNNSSWSRFFYDVGSNVVSTDILIETKVKKGDQINFGARGKNGRKWYPFHHTAKDDRYVIVLKNGDKAPSYAPAYNQSGVESFLSPYIDGSGRIRIGPRDVIVLWEASTASPGSTYFDMQDLVVLATFE